MALIVVMEQKFYFNCLVSSDSQTYKICEIIFSICIPKGGNYWLVQSVI